MSEEVAFPNNATSTTYMILINDSSILVVESIDAVGSELITVLGHGPVLVPVPSPKLDKPNKTITRPFSGFRRLIFRANDQCGRRGPSEFSPSPRPAPLPSLGFAATSRLCCRWRPRFVQLHRPRRFRYEKAGRRHPCPALREVACGASRRTRPSTRGNWPTRWGGSMEHRTSKRKRAAANEKILQRTD
jgi:hypothetical protein